MDIKYVDFDTKEEAEKEKPNITMENCMLGFCPLINDDCNNACICYKTTTLVEMDAAVKGKTVWRVYKPYCANGMFWRECNHDY